MEFLNKAFSQIADLFKSLTPGARLVTGLLLVAIVVSLGLLSMTRFQGGDDFLLGGVGFNASELPAMEAAFGRAGLNGHSIVGNRFRIPAGQQSRYMAALADAGALPSHFGDHLTKATSNTSPFISRSQQDEMMKVAKQQELALIIRSMKGVEAAAVLYDTERRGGLRPSATTTASVSVKALGGMPLEGNQVSMIRHLVAGSIAGLSPKDVTVADLNTGRVHADTGGADGAGSALDDPYLARKREYQALIAEQMYAALSYVPGVTVSVNADLSKELRRREENDLVDPKQTAPLSTREETTTSNQTTPSAGGRPGLAAQGANQPAALPAGAGAQSSEERSFTEQNNMISKRRSAADLVGLTPERVTVSIGVPMKYWVDVWRQQNPTPAGQPPKQPERAALEALEKLETERIRKHLEPLVPKPTTADATTPLVTVTTFNNIPADVATTPITDQALFWLGDHFQTLAMIVLVIVTLGMIRSFARGGAVAADLPPLPAGQVLSAVVGDEPPGSDDEPTPSGRLRKKLGSGPSLREELADLVKEDPDAAANILRSWIGTPG